MMRDMKEFNRMRDALDNARIAYKYKTRNPLGRITGIATGTVRGRLGSAGTPTEEMYEYEILVDKRDIETARSVIQF